MSKRSIDSRAEECLAHAQATAANATSWLDVQNAVFGPLGKMVQLFPDDADRTAFGDTPQFRQISELIDGLRDSKGDPEPIAVRAVRANGNLSIRMPKSLHAALLVEADAEGVSLNQLCLTKLAVQLRAVLTA